MLEDAVLGFQVQRVADTSKVIIDWHEIEIIARCTIALHDHETQRLGEREKEGEA